MRDQLHTDAEPGCEWEPEGPPISEQLPRRKLSELFWNLDWSSHLPLRLTDDGLSAYASSYDAALPFIRENYRAIFHEDANSAFSTTRLNAQKARYYRFAGDFFEIKEGDRTIALILGTPIDWSSYYIRSAAVLPEFQCKQLVTTMLRFMFGHLAASGVERIEADTSPSNLRVVHLLTSLDFNVTGSILSDRWGAQVRLTRFLDALSEDVFLRQFCTGVAYQLHDRVQRVAPETGPERRQS